MGRLIVAVLVVALAWMGFWVVAATLLDRKLTAFLETPQAGVNLSAAELEVDGFPNRLDTTLTDVSLTLPETGTAWQAPFVQFLALVYRPTEVIAVLPEAHALKTPTQTVDMTQTRARASVATEASTSLALDRATLIVENGLARSDLGWELALNEARFSIAEADEARYRIGAELLDVAPRPMPRDLPGLIERLHLDGHAEFSSRWDRRAVEEELPQVTSIDLDDLSIRWANMALSASGDLEVDGRGRPEGKLNLRLEGWERLFDIAVDQGVITGGFTPALKAALAALADGNELSVPLTFDRGFMSLGPIPLGPAPNLTIR